MTLKPRSASVSWIIIATSASSSTRRSRGFSSGRSPMTVPPRSLPLRAGLMARDFVSSLRGIENAQRKPRESQSNAALPPSCCSMLATMTFRPKLRVDGCAMGGPPFSAQCSESASGSNCHSSVMRPFGDDSAPCLAALVASSCRASASPCAVAGCSEISGPPHVTLSPARYGANSSATSVARSAPCQRESDNSVCARDSALMRPSMART